MMMVGVVLFVCYGSILARVWLEISLDWLLRAIEFCMLGIYDVLLVNMNLCIIPLHNVSKIEKLVLNIFKLIVEFPRFTKE